MNFLCRHLTPEPEQAAWGCRAIFRPDDRWVLDIVPDRVDMQGTETQRAVLREHLNTVLPFDVMNERIRELALDGREADGYVLWTDELVNVVCSPQGSYGYLYVTAVLKG